jgi:shikimate kinase
MSNIVLIGFMGSGKSSVASKISSISDYEFIDTDSLIEKKSKLTISEIFKIFGEKYFRELERETIKELLSYGKKLVIATGGGLPCYFKNIKDLKMLGKIFF